MQESSSSSRDFTSLDLPAGLALTPEEKRVKELGRELARDFRTRAAEHDRSRTSPVENFAKLREAGLYGVVIPKELGGMGLGSVGYVALAEELAQGCASTALSFNMHVNATGGIPQRSAISSSAKARVADLVLKEGALLSASASEPNSSSLLPRAFRFNVEARKVPGGYRLHGRKMFCSMFEASDYCYLFVHPESHPNPYQTLAALISTKQEGITVTDVWDTLGLRATRSNQVDYHGAFVPDDLILCDLDDFVQGFIIQEAAWAFGGFCACYMGLGLAIVEFARQHLSTRRASGYAQVMGYHPEVSRRFAEMVVDAETARLMVYRAAWESDQRGPGIETFHRWLKAKLVVGAAVQRIVSNAAIACGMHALFRNQALELMIRDAATAPIMPPNSDLCAAMIGLLSLGLDPGAAPSLLMAELQRS